MTLLYSLSQLRNKIGQEVDVSNWVNVPQERIQLFAEATGDYQWIHLDEGRCRTESPFGTTVAHGFLTLSLLPMLIEKVNILSDCRMAVNYGLNKVRFPAPLPAGSYVRARMMLQAIEDLADCSQLLWRVTLERQGGEKPVCVAESIMRQYPR